MIFQMSRHMNVESILSSDATKLVVFHKTFVLIYPFFFRLQSFNKLVAQAMRHNLYNFVEIFCCQWLGQTKRIFKEVKRKTVREPVNG